MARVQVALRIRPMSVAELRGGARPIAHRLDEQLVVLRDPVQDPSDVLRASHSRDKSYVFDAAFDSSATQETVYRATTQGLIAGVISGYDATIFAYGPTGCGKTYTMLGTESEPGICARALGDLFQAIEDGSGDTEYEVSMSYLEIYNETIRDLLNPSLGSLQLREDARGTVRVAGITEVTAVTAEEVLQLLVQGSRRRTQEPTAANRTSSRSHAVLQVTVRQRGWGLRRGRLFLIDLAGSERAAQTQNRGQRMKEGAHINRSLLALGNCINALSEQTGGTYVNYRDSKLTRLLKDSLGGYSRTVMIAHISPASSAFEESRSTLAYADRARSIRTAVKHNLLSVPHRTARYGGIVADPRGDIQHLKSQADPRPGLGRRRDTRYIQAQVQPGHVRDELLGACHEQAALRQRLLQLEGTALRARLVATRHLRTLSHWERRKQRWGKKGLRESDGSGDRRRGSDTGDKRLDAPEPPDVVAARGRIVALVEEQGRLREQKAELEHRFQRSQQHTRRLEEAVQRGSSSAEQQEVLVLLCRLHQLQLQTAELRSRSLLEGSPWPPLATAVQPFHRHRAPCAAERTLQSSPRTKRNSSPGRGTTEVAMGCRGEQDRQQDRAGSRATLRVPLCRSTESIVAKAVWHQSRVLGGPASGDSLEGTATRLGATQPGRSPDIWVQACKTLEKRQDAKRRERRSRSLEVGGHGVGAGIVPSGAGDTSLPVPNSTRKGECPRLSGGTGTSSEDGQSHWR